MNADGLAEALGWAEKCRYFLSQWVRLKAFKAPASGALSSSVL